MKTATPPSSFRKSTAKKSILSLRFSGAEREPVAQRSYGLMKISSYKSSTPFPRVDHGVDPVDLRERLKEHHQHEPKMKSMSSERIIHMRRSQSVSMSTYSFKDKGDFRKSLLMGTPHPSKGKAVDPRSLMKHLSDWEPPKKSPNRFFPVFNHSQRSTASESQKEPLGSRSTVVSGKSLLKRLNHPNPSPQRKSVTIKLSHESINDSGTRTGSDRSSDRLGTLSATSSIHFVQCKRTDFANVDFEERRRKFHEAEFTIAKRGRKLSDIVMPQPMSDDEIVDKSAWRGFDETAKQEIERFIRKEGLLKTQHDQITGLRTPIRSSRASVISMKPRSHSQSSMKSDRSKKSIKFST